MADNFQERKDLMKEKLRQSLDSSPATTRAASSGTSQPNHPSGLILTNIGSVPGKTIREHFGLVSGSMVRAKHLGTDMLAGLKNMVGGELGGYSKLLDETRNESIERMVAMARQLGANAVINIRFSTSSVAQGAAELYVYGTAVRVE